MDKSRKRELKKKWEKQQRAVARAALPLPNDQMKALFDHLDRELPKQGCDHTRRITQNWLENRGLPVDKVFAWLNDNGGFCDCEVLANSEQALELLLQ